MDELLGDIVAAKNEFAPPPPASPPRPASTSSGISAYDEAGCVAGIRAGINNSRALARATGEDDQSSARKSAVKFERAWQRVMGLRPEAKLEPLQQLFDTAALAGDFFGFASHLASFWLHLFMEKDPLNKNRPFAASVPLDSPLRWYHPGSIDVMVYGVVSWLTAATERFKTSHPVEGKTLITPLYDDATYFSKAHKTQVLVQNRAKKAGKGVTQGGSDSFTLGEFQDAVLDESQAMSEFNPAGLQRLVNAHVSIVGELRSEDTQALRTAAYRFYSLHDVPVDKSDPDVKMPRTYFKWSQWDPERGGHLGKNLNRGMKKGKFKWARTNNGPCLSVDAELSCAWQVLDHVTGKWEVAHGEVDPITQRCRLRCCSHTLCPHRALAKLFLLRPKPLAHDSLWLQVNDYVLTDERLLDNAFFTSSDEHGEWLEPNPAVGWYSQTKLGINRIKAMPAEGFHKLVAEGRNLSQHMFKKFAQQAMHRVGYDGPVRRGHGGHTSEAANEKYLSIDEAQRNEVGISIYQGVRPPTLAESQAAEQQAALDAKLDALIQIQQQQQQFMHSLMPYARAGGFQLENQVRHPSPSRGRRAVV
jgi:hypothetical protein